MLASGAEHRAHDHPNNFLSGVYYLRTQIGANTINFLDPRSQTGIIRPPVAELTAENTEQVVVRVKDGTLLLFPAYLRHSVDANASKEERISISFNIMFSAFTESLTKPLWSPDRIGGQARDGSERPLRRNARAMRQAPADVTWTISRAHNPLSLLTSASKDRLPDVSKPGRRISAVGAPPPNVRESPGVLPSARFFSDGGVAAN